MKTKHSLALICAASFILLVGIVVACSNEEADNHLLSSNPPAAKTANVGSSAITSCWEAFDEAYLRDSAAFYAACMNEDYEAFFQMTGITSEMISGVISYTGAIMQEYTDSHPEFLPNGGCHCSTNSLASLFYSAQGLYEAYTELGGAEPAEIRDLPVDPMSPELIACLDDCLYHYNYIIDTTQNSNYYFCVMNCYIEEQLRQIGPENPNLPDPLYP